MQGEKSRHLIADFLLFFFLFSSFFIGSTDHFFNLLPLVTLSSSPLSSPVPLRPHPLFLLRCSYLVVLVNFFFVCQNVPVFIV